MKSGEKQAPISVKRAEAATLTALPRGWLWVQFAELRDYSQNGFGKRNSTSGEPTPVIRLADIADNALQVNDLRYLLLSDAEQEQHHLQKGDVLVIRVNGSPALVGQPILFSREGTIAFCDHWSAPRYSVHLE
jgi:type I restriction enzyme S subunit